MRPRRRYVLRIRLAKAAESPCGIHTLFRAYEPAIRTPASLATVNRAPWIVLGLGAVSSADETDSNYQQQQQEPHGRLLVAPSNMNASPRILFHPARRPTTRGRRLAGRAFFGGLSCLLFVLDFFHGPLRSASGLPPGQPQKMAPTPCRSEPKFTSLGRMGDVHHRPSMSDAGRSDCRSIFCEVMASTKRSKFRDSKAVSLLGANGFALSPIRAVFLGQQSLGCRTGR